MALRVLHPDAPQPLVPPADVALMWHAHMGLSGDYAAMCLDMPQAAAGPAAGAGVGAGRSPSTSDDGASAMSDQQVGDRWMAVGLGVRPRGRSEGDTEDVRYACCALG